MSATRSNKVMTLNVNIFWMKIAMIITVVSMESSDKGLSENNIKYIMKSRSGKIGISLWELELFESSFFNFFLSSLWLLNLNSWFYSTFIFKGFDQNILIFDQCAIPIWLQFFNATTYTMKFCQNVLYMYMIKVKKFQECTCMRLYGGKQNIEGDANPPPPG